MTRLLCWAPLLICVGGLLFGLTALGDIDERYRRGVAAYGQQEYDRARTLLVDVFREHPGYVGRHGAAAFWLGEAYGRLGKPDSVRSVWEKGVEELRQQEKTDVRLFDAYLRLLLGDGKSVPKKRASGLYRLILRHVGADLEQWQLPVLRRHVSQLMPLLGEQAIRSHLVTENVGTPSEWEFREDGGEWLLSWWRRQDSVPSTSNNERLQLHLQRVAHAEKNFKSPDTVTGWDARGDVYVRYGSPHRRDRIPFRDMGFLTEVVRSGVSVSYSDFPGNEVWAYTNLSEEGCYLFFKNQQSGSYQMGTVMDLLPSVLRGPFGPGNRHQNVAYSSMAALRYIYNRLPRCYHDRGNLSSQLNGWFSYQESRRGLSGLSGEAGGRKIGFGSGARRVFGGNGPTRGYPSSVATMNIDQVRHQERQRARRRANEMPTAYAPREYSGIQPKVEYRFARFLNEDGTTRTEVYWGGRFASEGTKPRHLTVSAFRYDEQYRRVDDATTSYALGQDSTARRPGEEGRHLTLEGAADLFHVAVQWDRHTRADSTTGEETRRQVARIDSLTALHSDSSQLEMSDLQLMTIPETGDENAPRIDRAVLHPYDAVSTDSPILLYFELYHLQKDGPNGRTRYTVTYESTQRTRKDFFGRLFGDDFEEEVTSASSQYAGRRRSTREYIQLDLVDALKRRQPTEVTVRVRDDVSGQRAERTIQLTLVPAGDSPS